MDHWPVETQGATAISQAQAGNMKGRSLGERPAFLRSPPGFGVSKPWGVWEGGFDERLGGPPAGYVDLWCRARLGAEAQPISWEKPFRYELQEA